MKRNAIAVAILMLIALLAGSVSAASYSQNLVANDTLSITCDGMLTIAVVDQKNVTVQCLPTSNPTATATSVPTTTVVPSVTPVVTPIPTNNGLWLSTEEIKALPMSGAAWDNVKSKALGSWGSANLQDLNSNHDVYTLAGALYYARTGDTATRTKVANAIISSIPTITGSDNRTLAPSRNIVSYVIAADLINLKQLDSAKDNQWRAFLTEARNKTIDGRTIISTQEDRPNNWGTHAGATRVAIARYLGDTADLDRAAQVFKGWLGDRSAYAGFDYGELDWQADPSKPVGINPKGATKNGYNIDGVLPDDQRRGCGFTIPACKENYVWEALQGASVEAWLLHRAGYDVFNWSDKALYRATNWLYTVNNFPATDNDDTFIPWIFNKAYGTSFSTTSPVGIGKNMSFTDWTHR